MKTLNETFEDSEFKELEKMKIESKAKSWREFILGCTIRRDQK